MITGNKQYRIISNQVGTPELLIDVATGSVADKFEFDEFGIPHDRDPRSTLPFGFAGGLYDRDTGLVHFGARDYDPEMGRWLSKDPILFKGGDTNLYSYTGTVGKPPFSETNLYQYSLSDPINFIDPEGLSAQDTAIRYIGCGLGGAMAGAATCVVVGKMCIPIMGIGFAIGVALCPDPGKTEPKCDSNLQCCQ